MITPELIDAVHERFELEPQGIHGRPHWERVRENGLRLAAATGAKAHIVELFAWLHDACREHDGDDPGHGPRAAEFARGLVGRVFELPADEFELLYVAIRDHGEGLRDGDVTVLTCWDADRLDLGRIGTVPRADRLCTAAARDPGLMAWAYERSIRDEW